MTYQPNPIPSGAFQPAAPAGLSIPSLPSTMTSTKVMIVDDEPVNIAVLRKYLQLAGYTNFLTATDPHKALGMVNEERPDILLLDVMMPEISGLEILERIRAHEQTAHIPVIIVTASSDMMVKQIALDLGATDFLTKPVDSSDLLPRVRNALAVKAYQDQLKRYSEELEHEVEHRRNAEMELYRAKEAAMAENRTKSEFLANMSHEIRTPMTAILGYADVLLADENQRTASPERQSALQTINRNGDYLLELINDILDLSKIEAGGLEVEFIEVSPSRLLADVLPVMSVRAKEKGIDLKAEVDGVIPETIQSDPTRLRQILINLVGNAIKFTNEGEVRLVTRYLSPVDGKPRLQFEVLDTGIGMTAEEISRLFRPFVQADASTTRRFGGTGLGLTITKRLVEILGGTIQVESVPNEGSVFRVTLPVVPREAEPMTGRIDAWSAEDTNSVDEEVVSVRGRVLLAEDGPDNQRIVTFFLQKAGAEVTVVENGELAVECALKALNEERPFDVVLMDMQMPLLDGYGATRQLREKGYSGPIIALTAHAMNNDREKCIDAGCDDYATKPIDRQKLLKLVAMYTKATEESFPSPTIDT